MSLPHALCIRPGKGRPLFLIHSIAGELTWVRHMAKYLETGHALYAFAAPGLNAEAPFFFRLEAMAAAYLRDLRQVQPRGPYLLGGYSMGGVLAFEIARQLQAAGEPVAQLILMDAFAPRAALGQQICHWSRNGLLLQVITNQLALQWQARQLLPPEALPRLPFNAQSGHGARHLLEHCRVPHQEQALSAYLRRCQILMRVHAQLLADYRPTPLAPGPRVLLLRNTLGLIGQPSALALPQLPEPERNPAHAWEALLPAPPATLPLAGEHFMLGGEAPMAELCRILAPELEPDG